jgi:hypothetical protein
VRVDDARAVLLTAELHGVSEFQVFALAYRAWYREEASEAVIERHFAPYMFDQSVPFWVRQFTRSEIEAHGDWQLREEMTAGGYAKTLLAGLIAATLDNFELALGLFLLDFPEYDSAPAREGLAA